MKKRQAHDETESLAISKPTGLMFICQVQGQDGLVGNGLKAAGNRKYLRCRTTLGDPDYFQYQTVSSQLPVKIRSLHNNRVICKVRWLGARTASFDIIGHQMCNWEWNFLQKEITGTQTSFSTNFGDTLSFIMCFLFPERLHCYYIYFQCSDLYKYYNYSWTLCIKCWVSAFHTQI